MNKIFGEIRLWRFLDFLEATLLKLKLRQVPWDIMESLGRNWTGKGVRKTRKGPVQNTCFVHVRSQILPWASPGAELGRTLFGRLWRAANSWGLRDQWPDPVASHVQRERNFLLSRINCCFAIGRHANIGQQLALGECSLLASNLSVTYTH